MDIKVGDYVKTPRDRIGRVSNVRRLTNADAWWVRLQKVQPTLEELLGEWASILVHDGGSVLVAIDTLVKIPPIENFYHPWESEYFK